MTTWVTLVRTLPGLASAAAVDAAAPAFDLRRWGTDQKVSLQEMRGGIVVLDFFAHWCGPCVRTSAEVESGIRQYYAERKGNAHGIPVSVFAVNIEAARPEKTEAFIERMGLKQVLDDVDGGVFQQYRGSGLPFLVIVDATDGRDGTAPPRIVYRKAGFEGVARLRQVIDSIGVKIPVSVAANMGASAASPTMGAIESAPQTRTLAPSSTSKVGLTSTATQKAGEALQNAESSNLPAETKANKATTTATNLPPPKVNPSGEVIHKAGLDFAMLWASDILLTDGTAEYRQTRADSELTISLTHAYIGLHYVPEAMLEEKKDVENDRFGFQTTGRFRASDRVTLMGGGGAYDGYTDYDSLWLNEHFRQLFSGRPGYEKAHPWGYNVSGGLRLEYLPGSGFVQGDLAYQHDVISPGYDVSLATFPPRLVRFRDTYDTLSGRLTLENVLTPRLRAKQELQITDTTDRQLRYALQSSLNYAPAEHWVSRLTGGYTEEAPQFEAWFAGATVERDWNETWFVSLTGRYYGDTGQIENALLAENTAAPPLEACQVGVGLRWQGSNSSAKLVVGPYFTRYDPSGVDASIYGHLYQNRDWLSVQFAFAHEF